MYMFMYFYIIICDVLLHVILTLFLKIIYSPLLPYDDVLLLQRSVFGFHAKLLLVRAGRMVNGGCVFGLLFWCG